MLDQISERMKIKKWSNDGIGENIAINWDIERWGKTPTPRSIGVKVGELLKGKKTWWQKREGPSRLLAEALEIDSDELWLWLCDEPTSHLNKIYKFKEFPFVRPFDPRSEKPLIITRPNLFSDIREDELTWVTIPSTGAGRNFIAHWHKIKRTADVQRFKSLREAAHLAHSEGPLLLLIDSPSEFYEKNDKEDGKSANTNKSDIQFSEKFAQRKQIRIFAKFNIVEPFSEEAKNNPWKCHTLEFEEGWRIRFCEWIENRLSTPDSLFTGKELSQWLDEIDPDHRYLKTPGDVLPFCWLAHDFAIHTLKKNWLESKQILFEEWFNKFLDRNKTGHETEFEWLKIHGMECLKSISRTWLFNHTRSFDQGPGIDNVVDLLSTGTNFSIDDDSELAQIENETSREKIKVLLSEYRINKLGRDSRRVINVLLKSGLLVEDNQGNIWPQPGWIISHWQKDETLKLIKNEPSSVWGKLVLDENRSQFIDQALDRLDKKGLTKLANEIIKEFNPANLGEVGALESVFAAVGRKLQTDPKWKISPDLIKSLCDIQIQLTISRFPSVPPAPRTRAGIGDWGKGNTWVVDCWAISLSLVKPNGLAIPEKLHWLFPGWCEISWEEIPPWVSGNLNLPWKYDSDFDWRFDRADENRKPSEYRLLDLVPSVLKKIKGNRPDQIPKIFLIDLLIHTIHHEPDEIISELLEKIIIRNNYSDYFFARAKENNPELLAQVVWNNMLEAKGSNLENAIWSLAQRNNLFNFIISHLSFQNFSESIQNADPGNDPAYLFEIPPEWRLEIARKNKDNQHFFDRLASHFRTNEILLTEDDSDLIELFLEGAGGIQKWQAMRWYWQIAPEMDIDRIRHQLDENNDDTKYWFWEAPSSRFSELLALLEKNEKAIHYEWVKPYLARRLLQYSEYADRIYALIVKTG
jgi:hypothetical protein